MVFFVLTRRGYDELCRSLGRAPSTIWVADGVLSEAELSKLSGVSISNFDFPLSPSDAAGIEDALSTIALHHPGETIWVERGAP